MREKELRNSKDGTADKKANGGRKCYSHAFALMDLDTRMYIGYGTSTVSEQEAYHKALAMTREIGIEIRSVRLDKLYSYQSVTDDFGSETDIYVIPKRNATIKGTAEWRRIVRNFFENPFGHLSEYYLRNNSESGFSVDKRLCGWQVWQKLDDRVCTSMMCKGLWHNLMLIG
jgi:transposase